jgi:hypothetical protein
MSESSFYKNEPNSKVYWVDNPDAIGVHEFSFDKKRVFNLFEDYPYALTPEEKAIFDKYEPYWADFFKDRCNPE